MHQQDNSRQPTLLLVHGAFAGAWAWEPVLEPLRRRGIRVAAVDRLPSVGGDPGALGDLRDDGDHVRALVERIGAPVVLCGHSYGGMVITELADHAGVVHSVYLAALWPGAGQSLSDMLGGPLPEWIVDRGDGSLAVREDVERVREALFADLDAGRAAQIYARMMPQSVASFLTPSAAPPRSHPVTYLLCTEDGALPLEAQEGMAAAADHAVRLGTTHCPQLTAPETLADALAGVILEDVVAKAARGDVAGPDAYQPKTEPRPYREPLAPRQAAEELVGGERRTPQF
jgi:pimeloyl-ACP methyl ester carboxylesterase